MILITILNGGGWPETPSRRTFTRACCCLFRPEPSSHLASGCFFDLPSSTGHGVLLAGTRFEQIGNGTIGSACFGGQADLAGAIG